MKRRKGIPTMQQGLVAPATLYAQAQHNQIPLNFYSQMSLTQEIEINPKKNKQVKKQSLIINPTE